MVTLLAVPTMRIVLALLTDALNNEANSFCGPLGSMRNMRRKQIDAALGDHDIQRFALMLNPQIHLALKLKEKFFRLIDMVVGPRIWSADYRHHEVPCPQNSMGRRGWPQTLGVFSNPSEKVE